MLARRANSAWDLANLYLSSVDAELLGPEAPSLLGLSQETTCYVSADYFKDDARFADYVVHEAAHVFHNCKRATAGLPETRTREWLLLLEFRKRETFAYSSEAYGWIVEHANTKADRMAMREEFSGRASRAPGARVREPGAPGRCDSACRACATRRRAARRRPRRRARKGPAAAPAARACVPGRRGCGRCAPRGSSR